MTRYIDRIIFGLDLQQARACVDPRAALKGLLHQVIVGDEVELSEEDAAAITIAAQSLEAVIQDPQHQLSLVAELGDALVKSDSGSQALELVHLVLERGRIIDVVSKHLDGIISRTGWLSYLAEQRWPARLRETIRQLDSAGLLKFRAALREGDWRAVQDLFIAGAS